MLNANRFGSRKLTLCALALALSACSDDDGPGSSGVDPAKTLDQVSQEDVDALCDWAYGLISDEDILRFGCYFAGVTRSGGDRSACEEFVQTCLDEARPIDRDQLQCTLGEDLPACAREITVEEIEDCMAAGAGQFGDFANAASCDSSPDDFGGPAERSPACDAVAEQCPELYEGAPEEVVRRLTLLTRP